MNVKEYWDSRAELHRGNPLATTDDVFLRELEFKALTETIRGLEIEGWVLDVGCGDGLTTIRLAEEFPELEFHAIDYSENMIDIAQGVGSRVEFSVGDVTNLEDLPEFDLVISDRCLINLETSTAQSLAIEQIAAHTKCFIAIENFIEGHNAMNQARACVGLDEIPVRWHNLYLIKGSFMREVAKHFDHITWNDFASSYYFATRVVCPAVGGEYYNEMAIKLPPIGEFSPVRMAVMW
jgi:SAM-dependent methyltransferase